MTHETEIWLREVTEADLPTLYEHQADPAAYAMAAFQPRKRSAFMEHWRKILNDASVTVRAIEFRGKLAGTVLRFERGGMQEIGYWIGREHWGQGVASRALARFLEIEPIRPLFAIVAEHNAASLRVLEKCGFTLADSNFKGEDHPVPDVVDCLFRLGHEEVQ